MDINFKFEEHTYTAPGSFYDINRFTLPDGRAIAASGWLETMPPKPQGLHVVAEVAADDRRARTALLAAAHAALAALKSFEAVMVEHEDADIGATLALPLMAIRSSVNCTLGMIEGRLPPVERTPGVVLRAMLRAYEAATLRAAVEHWSTHSPKSPLRTLLSRRTDVLDACARHVARSEVVVSPEIAADYEARLRGDRPLDAPPMEVP